MPDGRDVKRNLGRLDWDASAGSAWSLNPVAPLEHINCFTRKALVTMGARANLNPTFVPCRLVIGTSSGVASGAFVKKVVKSLMGRWARLLVKRGTTVLLESAS